MYEKGRLLGFYDMTFAPRCMVNGDIPHTFTDLAILFFCHVITITANSKTGITALIF